ncbi:MAG: inositol monophosphatase family protein [Candidatus Bilamarchaeum sp.]|jgi:myo-inositol-1(or 4)-monophosphatase
MEHKKISEFLIILTAQLKQKLDKFYLEEENPAREIGTGAGGDRTTVLDKFSEDFIVKELSENFKCTILSEELGEKDFGSKDLVFIIDPIDGTMNAKRKMPPYCCSIAALEKGEVIVGVVRDLISNEVFSAIKGRGSFCNGKKIHAKKFEKLETAIVLYGRPISQSDKERYVRLTNRFLSHRILGAAALEGCYVASGRAEILMHIHEKRLLKMVDIAASKLIIEEAGGILLDEEGNRVEVVASLTKKINTIGAHKECIEKVLAIVK